jgi:hypothetical protein
MVRWGLVAAQRAAGRFSFEMLVTPQQIEEWLARNTRGG